MARLLRLLLLGSAAWRSPAVRLRASAATAAARGGDAPQLEEPDVALQQEEAEEASSERCRQLFAQPSLGAPPVFTGVYGCKASRAQRLESEMMDFLDRQWASGRSLREGAVLVANERGQLSAGADLGRLGGRQPFLFGHLVNSSMGVVREMERPTDNQAVMERPLPTKHFKYHKHFMLGFGHPATVLLDEGRFVMFYHASKFGDIGRAESADGIHWGNCTVMDFRLYFGTEFCVLLDKYEEDPRFKYKMLSNCQTALYETCLHTSPDGIRWTHHVGGQPIWGRYSDTLACLHHDSPGKEYQMTTRYEKPNFRVEGRGIRGLVTVNGTLDELLQLTEKPEKLVRWETNVLGSLILDRDFGDAEMFRRQLYSMGRTLLPGAGHVGISQIYEFAERSRQPEDFAADLKKATELGLQDRFAAVNLFLMPSRDGIHYDSSWVYADAPLLPDDMTSGYHFLNQASEVLTHGGYHWVYYDRSPTRHYDKWDPPGFQIMLARFQEGRMVRLRPVEDRGEVVTQSFLFDPKQKLTLDVLSLKDDSLVTVDLLPADGPGGDGLGLLTVEAAAEAKPIRGINGSTPVEWRGSVARFRGQHVHLRFGLSSVYLYSFALA